MYLPICIKFALKRFHTVFFIERTNNIHLLITINGISVIIWLLAKIDYTSVFLVVPISTDKRRSTVYVFSDTDCFRFYIQVKREPFVIKLLN